MSQTLDIYQVDAFAENTFQGNPAAVVPLTEWLPDEVLQNIAAENNLSETAYFIDRGDHYHLRWFTPAKEVRLCGHATLASSHVLFQHLGYAKKEIHFKALAGSLFVKKEGDLLSMNFPADPFQKVDAPDGLAEIIGAEIQDAVVGTDDLLVRIANKVHLDALQPDFKGMAELLDYRGLIVTTTGKETDVASRCFYPTYGIDEDPVTGSAHTLLTPYWSKLLEKDTLSFVQGGSRRGYLRCKNLGERVEISGPAATYLEGKISI